MENDGQQPSKRSCNNRRKMTKGKFQLSPFLTQLKKKEYGCDCHFATTKKNPRLMEIKVTVFMRKKNDGKHKKYV